jgi:hypothetical protein
MSSAAFAAQDVVLEIERVRAESGYGHVRVIIADGRIERIDRCVQIKPAGGPFRPVAARSAGGRG